MLVRPTIPSSHHRSSNGKDAPRLMSSGISPKGTKVMTHKVALHPPSGVRLRAQSEQRAERRATPKRASPKNMRDIVRAEVMRTHADPRIERFDQVVMIYCGQVLGVLGDRRCVEQYVHSHLRAEAAKVNDKAAGTVFTPEAAKLLAQQVYRSIARAILHIADQGDEQSAPGGAIYRVGQVPGPHKRQLILTLEGNRVTKVTTDKRFERQTPTFVHPGRPVRKIVAKPRYINTPSMVA